MFSSTIGHCIGSRSCTIGMFTPATLKTPVLLQQPRRCLPTHRSTVLQVSAVCDKQPQPSDHGSSVPRKRRRTLLISMLVAANTAVWIKLSSAQPHLVRYSGCLINITLLTTGTGQATQ